MWLCVGSTAYFTQMGVDSRLKRIVEDVSLSRPPLSHRGASQEAFANSGDSLSKFWVDLGEAVRMLERCEDLVQEHSEALTIIVRGLR